MNEYKRSKRLFKIRGEKELEEELKHLKGAKRKEILANLQYAKSLGDLSENAEYHQTREDQAELENQIKRIERILSSAEVITGGGTDIVEVGSSVLVSKIGDKKEKNFRNIDSLNEKLNLLMEVDNFPNINNTYQELISSGQQALIKNKELSVSIIDYYLYCLIGRITHHLILCFQIPLYCQGLISIPKDNS
jgi:hypothetical protein